MGIIMVLVGEWDCDRGVGVEGMDEGLTAGMVRLRKYIKLR